MDLKRVYGTGNWTNFDTLLLGDEEVLQREDISPDFDGKSSTFIYRFHTTGSVELTGNYAALVTSCQKYTYPVDQVLSELL